MTGRVISDKVGGPGGPRNEFRHATAGHFRDPVRNRFSTCRHPPHRPNETEETTFLCLVAVLLCSALWPIVAQYNHSTTALPIYMNCSVTDMFLTPPQWNTDISEINRYMATPSPPSAARPVKRNIRIGKAIDSGQKLTKKKAKSMATLIL
jgi:hypothetical protein